MAAAAAVVGMAAGVSPESDEVRKLRARIRQVPAAAEMSAEQKARYHGALGDAYRVLSDHARAKAEYTAGLVASPGSGRCHEGIAALRFPGPGYLDWLDRLQLALKPEHYLEIGIWRGASLALARPPTVAIGIDLAPQPAIEIRTETHIYAESSAEFFRRERLSRLLGGAALRLAFIDGSHLVEDALDDFNGVEAHGDQRTVVVLHDTLPHAEIVQRREKSAGFYTGDVWRVAVGLKKYRPDLRVVTLPTYPSGLTVVTGLDPKKRVLVESRDAVVADLLATPWEAVAGRETEALGVIANDWDALAARFRADGVL